MLCGLNPKAVMEEQCHQRGIIIPVFIEVKVLHISQHAVKHINENFKIPSFIICRLWTQRPDALPARMSGIHPSGYMVTKVKDSCEECTESIVCKMPMDKCGFLYQHMNICSYYSMHRNTTTTIIGRIPTFWESSPTTAQGCPGKQSTYADSKHP